MHRKDIDTTTLPTEPGIYLFRDSDDTMLYVGRATNLRSRVVSYFSNRLIEDRGQRIAEAVAKAKTVETVVTDSVLEAYILEAHYIKTYQPAYNVIDKDNKSFQYVGITDEPFPAVRIVRGRDLEQGVSGVQFKHLYGPFPRGSLLKEALLILRKVLPFRDSCAPGEHGRPCFRAQIDLCPGICTGAVTKRQYARRIRELCLFFEGKKKQLVALLEKTMHQHAKRQEFEEAELVRRRIVSLTYIQDVSLMKREFTETLSDGTTFRVEAYDIAHTAGRHTVGVMVVFVDGERSLQDYRVFIPNTAAAGDDIAGLREILSRRLNHPEWRFPHLIVVDGGKAHRSAAERVLADHGVAIPVVAVVKNEHHAPREVLGNPSLVKTHERPVIAANAEAHRFALARHRKKHARSFLK